jgi:DNA-3-methyladenine glycosylase
MSKIKKSFYLREDVVQVAKDLLGKYIFTNLNNDGLTGGIIVETEAYAGITDRASHAYGNRRTERTEIMYLEGGVAYIYLCYGIHSLFNIVTYKENIPHAVLIRGIQPVEGLDIMLRRSGKIKIDKLFGIGPGKVSKILGIHFAQTGESLLENKIWLEDKGIKVKPSDIIASTRIGVDYAGEDAKLLYRFCIDTSVLL